MRPRKARARRRTQREQPARVAKLDRVYFIQNTADLSIKIGTSKDVPGRLESLQTSTAATLVLLATTEGDRELETLFHSVLREHHIRGEWFRPHPDVLAQVEAGSFSMTSAVAEEADQPPTNDIP